MLSKFLDYVNEYGLFPTVKKIYNQFNPKAIINFYLYIKGIQSGDYAYRGPDWVQIDLTNNCNNNCIGCWCNFSLLREKKIDPKELNNLVEVEKEQFEFMKAKLEEWMNRPKPDISSKTKPLDEETKKRLKSLGYLQ